MTQTGDVVDIHRVRVDGHPLGSARLNRIATASAGSRLWVSYVGWLPGGRDALGGVHELPPSHRTIGRVEHDDRVTQ